MNLNFPDELLIHIISFFNFHDNYFFCSSCQLFLQLGASNFLNLIKDKKKFICTRFSNIICKIMNGVSTLVFAPILPFKNNFISIDYVDNIKTSDVWAPIMIGIDMFNRPFITIRILEEGEKSSLTTIFQRYTNDKETWAHGTCYYSRLLGDDPSRIINRGIIQGKMFEENIKDLLNNNGYIKYASYKNEHIKIQASLC